MRRKLIAGNWKMNNDVEESINLVKELKLLLKDADIDDMDVLVCPPFTSTYAISHEIKSSSIKLGAQNMFFEEKGAYTGEISPLMLKNLGVEYVILGHSERRKYFNETDDIVNKKIISSLKYGIKPILCIGESLTQRELGTELAVIKKQIKKDFENITKEEAINIVIAYEPIWAIGTGKIASNEQIETMCSFIRNAVKELYGSEVSDSTLILYGGSVNGENATEVLNQKNVDGALVGGASLKSAEFIKIINYVK